MDGDGRGIASDSGGELECHGGPFRGGEVKGGFGRGFAIDSCGGAFNVVGGVSCSCSALL
jgi:hypothetical protein